MLEKTSVVKCSCVAGLSAVVKTICSAPSKHSSHRRNEGLKKIQKKNPTHSALKRFKASGFNSAPKCVWVWGNVKTAFDHENKERGKREKKTCSGFPLWKQVDFCFTHMHYSSAFG